METVQDVKPSVTADSSIKDILAEASKQPDTTVADGSETSTGEEQGHETTVEAGKAEKTNVEKSPDMNELEQGIQEGKPVPYDRFKKVNETRKALKGEVETLKTEHQQFRELLNNPEVLKAVRTAQGFTEEAINEELQELVVMPPKEEAQVEEKEPEFDLETVEGWNNKIEYSVKKAISEALSKELNPIKQTLTQAQKAEQEKQFNARLSTEKSEAEKLAKDVYGIEYGDESNATDASTGAGKIMNYLDKYPDKAKAASQGILSKSDLLRLAIAEEGVKLGEKKGELKEKKRVADLKSAAMEGSSETQTDEFPNADWREGRILEWLKTHPNAKL